MIDDSASPGPPSEDTARPTLVERAREFWTRHRRLFWMLHSTWALVAGAGIVILARERYHLVLWVVVFLVLTWASTLFFGRAPSGGAGAGAPPSLAHEVTSYVTRIMYQETLFFLLPFYTYSTVLGSPNVLFLGLLGALAIFSCLDLVFDRWLRTKPLFSLTFFALVAFAALNLLLPLIFGLRLEISTPAAALLALAGTIPLALRSVPRARGTALRLMLAGAVMLLVAIRLPVLVPPVPLRLESATFAADIDQDSLTLVDPFEGTAPASDFGSSLVVLVQVFAPSAVPTEVSLEWKHDGQTVRVSRDIEIVAHEEGFRVWDGWHPSGGLAPPGHYEVILRTQDDRVFGVARLTVT